MNHYKSWKYLNNQLSSHLCDKLKNHIRFFLTFYHKVHNSYGRAAIIYDDTEIVNFSWIEMYHQEQDISMQLKEKNYNEEFLKYKWDNECAYCQMDFLNSAVNFLNMPISESLSSDNMIIKILAIMDKRVGKRTLKKISDLEEYKTYPLWVQQFYKLRL